MRMILVSGLALAVAACGSADVADGGGDDSGLTMKAGKWSQTMMIESFELPGAPPEVAEMMKGMIGNAQTTETCMTEDQIAKGWEEQAKNSMAGQECDTESFDSDGGKLTGKVVCKAANGAGATMVIDGAYAEESMNMTMSADIDDPSMPGGVGKMVMKITGERVGECDA